MNACMRRNCLQVGVYPKAAFSGGNLPATCMTLMKTRPVFLIFFAASRISPKASEAQADCPKAATFSGGP
eukprot:3005891-Amphidinium_carterae.2